MTETPNETPLFDMAGTNLLNEPVVVQTMWGEENGVVVDYLRNAGGFPMAQVLLEMGDTISIDVARLKKRSAR